jgi:ATPase subunit of ABC transporter with duplicated ATPase domains
MGLTDAAKGGGSEVRYFLDEVSGRVVALGAGVLRVLSEIRTAYNEPLVKRKSRRPAGAAARSTKGSRRKRPRAAQPVAEKASARTKKVKSRGRRAGRKNAGTKRAGKRKEK